MLDDARIEVAEERQSQKSPFTEADIKALLKSVRTVVLARGKKIVRLEAAVVKPDDLKGPTGNYRAPMVRQGTTLLVGFNEAALKELL